MKVTVYGRTRREAIAKAVAQTESPSRKAQVGRVTLVPNPERWESVKRYEVNVTLVPR